MDMAQVQQSLQLFNNEVEQRKGKRNTLQSLINSKEEELTEETAKVDLMQKVIKIYQLASVYARNQAKTTMERLNTSALNCVYPEDMTFRIEMDTEGKGDAELLVTTKYEDHVVVNDPEEDGGGVSDVVALASRISLLETAQPRQEGPLVLDEPGKHLGDLNQNLAPFLDMVSNSFSRQIIMVTHDPYLAEAGHRSFKVVKKDGVSTVTQL